MVVLGSASSPLPQVPVKSDSLLLNLDPYHKFPVAMAAVPTSIGNVELQG